MKASRGDRRERPRRLVQGQLVEGRITRLGHGPAPEGEADGGARVRVLGGVPGDRLRLRIIHAGQHLAWARIDEVLEASPDRVEPPCPAVGRCGGCPWQAVAPEAQRAAREATIRQALGDLAASAEWHPWIAGDASVGFRTRALMMARHVSGRLRLGFFAPSTNELVPAEGCVVQHPILVRALGAAGDALARARVSTWRGAPRGGLLRAVSMRVA